VSLFTHRHDQGEGRALKRSRSENGVTALLLMPSFHATRWPTVLLNVLANALD